MIKKQTRKTWLIALLFLMMPSLLLAQSYGKKTLITIGDKKISAQEFMNTYEKNNINNTFVHLHFLRARHRSCNGCQ